MRELAHNDMPLTRLADEIQRLSEQAGSTPVLVTPQYLSLRRPFFEHLVRALAARTTRPIRIDWYRRVPSYTSVLGDAVARWKLARDNRALRRVASGCQTPAAMQITAAISRPGGIHRDLVIGWSDHRLPLPPWATPIHLGATPELSSLSESATIATLR